MTLTPPPLERSFATSELVLQTSRLLLRPVVEADAPAIRLFSRERDVAVWTGSKPHPYPDEEADAFIEKVVTSERNGEAICRGIVVSSRGPRSDVVGVTFLKRDDVNRNGYVGYHLAKPEWGQGFGTEAAAALVDFAFEKLDYVRVWSSCFADNDRSAHVLSKLGLAEEGLQRRHFCKWGEWKDVRLFGLLREEWNRRKDGVES